MTISRRRLLAATAAAPLAAPWIGGTARAEAKKLKISHQFPGGTIDTGDFRDQLCRRFAAELDKRTNGALGAEIYPNSSLVKTVAQYSAIRRGALDMTLYPLNYAGGEVSEYNIGFMPGVVSSYEQGYAWKKAEIGKQLNALMAEKGAVLVTWLWQAGGSASRDAKPILVPEDVKGKKVRGGSREMDLMLKGAGASVVSMPSNELYAAMQTGTMDVCMTTSTSFISFRLEEIAKSLTTGAQEELLLRVRAAADVQAGLRRPAEGPADGDHGHRRGDGEVRAREGQGRRRGRRQGLREARHQDLRHRPGAGRQVEGRRARHLLEGIRRQVGQQRRVPEAVAASLGA